MTRSPDPDDYYRTIEEEFNRWRGAPIILSPRDWSLIGEWRETGVPLRIALQGIANVFEAFARRPSTARRINSLSYCRQEVLALHELYLGLRGAAAGRPEGTVPVDTVGVVLRHLGRLARRVREAMAHCSMTRLDPLVGVLAGVAAELKRIRRDVRTGATETGDLERMLREFDDRILATARRALPAETVRTLEETCDQQLGGQADRMSPEAYARTRQALFAHMLRRQCALPRLTLFD